MRWELFSATTIIHSVNMYTLKRGRSWYEYLHQFSRLIVDLIFRPPSLVRDLAYVLFFQIGPKCTVIKMLKNLSKSSYGYNLSTAWNQLYQPELLWLTQKKNYRLLVIIKHSKHTVIYAQNHRDNLQFIYPQNQNCEHPKGQACLLKLQYLFLDLETHVYGQLLIWSPLTLAVAA